MGREKLLGILKKNMFLDMKNLLLTLCSYDLGLGEGGGAKSLSRHVRKEYIFFLKRFLVIKLVLQLPPDPVQAFKWMHSWAPSLTVLPNCHIMNQDSASGRLYVTWNPTFVGYDGYGRNNYNNYDSYFNSRSDYYPVYRYDVAFI